ncbi:MAG: hypothetical protein OIF56_00930 [Cohaesibacter sp.]|nr:hypothetical protein [Cohaesibacter sp.]
MPSAICRSHHRSVIGFGQGQKTSGIALKAQDWPDVPNHPNFPSILLKAGEIYRWITIYQFDCL